MNDDDLVRAFRADALTGLSHEEHVRVTWALIRSGEPDPVDVMRRGLRCLAARAGHPERYHETRTIAWCRLIAVAAGDGSTFAEFLAAHPEFERRDLLDDYYSPELLATDGARTSFAQPDRRFLTTWLC